jgi:hypothetical protein
MEPVPSRADIRTHIIAHGRVLTEAVNTIRLATEHWHTTLLIDLAGENVWNCLELVEGDKQGNASRCAWAARNLLELHYFTRFVMASPENALRFHEDMACDYQDLLRRLGKNGAYAQTIATGQAILAHLWSHHAKRAGKNTKFLSTRQIATDLGEEVVFGDAHKFLSKLLHPTSLSIQMRKSSEWKAILVPTIVGTAARLIAHTFPLLSAHIRSHSVRT